MLWHNLHISFPVPADFFIINTKYHLLFIDMELKGEGTDTSRWGTVHLQLLQPINTKQREQYMYSVTSFITTTRDNYK